MNCDMSVAKLTLIESEQLKCAIEQAVKKCRKKLVFISAYITYAAIEWLDKYVPEHAEVHLVCRLTPSDAEAGSTDISALIRALESGWKVSCLHSLHAKLYSIDDEQIYVGSANLTSNGLKIYGEGNIEVSTCIPASQEDLFLISRIEESASSLNEAVLQKMETYINDEGRDKKHVTHPDMWPQDILPDKEGIWVRDFFWCNPKTNLSESDEERHDLELIGVKSLKPVSKEISKKVLMSRCVQWLISKLRNQREKELYFGRITNILHNELKDDPAPYRKEVKTLVQNLLAYCEAFIPEKLEISRPNYSQRVRLLVAK